MALSEKSFDQLQKLNKNEKIQTIITPIKEEKGGGKFLEKLRGNRVVEMYRYDKEGKIIEFINEEQLNKLKKKYKDVLIMQGVDEEQANNISEELHLSIYPDISETTKMRILELLNNQSFMDHDKK